MSLLVVALDVVVIIVVEVRNKVAIVGVDVPAVRRVLRDDVRAHVGVLNMDLFLLLLLLLVLLLQSLPQVFLVKVLMRCLRRFDDLINRFFRA